MRDDYHTLLIKSDVRSILSKLTFGLIRIVEPVRCEACGRVRARGFWDAAPSEVALPVVGPKPNHTPEG